MIFHSKVYKQCERHREEIELLLGRCRVARDSFATSKGGRLLSSPLDVLISPNEINQEHGTGVLVQLLYGKGSGFLSVRAHSLYANHEFGRHSVKVDDGCTSRAQCFEAALKILARHQIGRVLCIPYFEKDLLLAIAMKEIANVPLVIYVMDDQLVHSSAPIPRQLAQEAFDKADLRIVISPEMRDAYEATFQKKFWLVPPVVDANTVLGQPAPLPERDGNCGILIGNVWSADWLQKLRTATREAGVRLDWYGKLHDWYNVDPAELEKDGISVKGHIPASELAQVCSRYAFAVIPTGSPDDEGHGGAICAYSIPSRMPFIMACTGTPMLVMGSPKSAAAGFVRRFEVGEITGYDAGELRAAADRMAASEYQEKARKRAFEKGGVFSAKGVGDWIWQSLKEGRAADKRFDEAMPREKGKLIEWMEDPAPKELWGDFKKVFIPFRRLKDNGFDADFVVDIGASGGIWSHTLFQVFPKSRFILVDPLEQQYKDRNAFHYTETISKFEQVTAAAGNEVGTAQFQVSDDLYSTLR